MKKHTKIHSIKFLNKKILFLSSITVFFLVKINTVLSACDPLSSNFDPTGCASAPTTPTTFAELVEIVLQIFNRFVPVVIGAGVVFLSWGIVKMIYNMDNEQVRTEGRKMVLFSVIAIFVMVSMWGFVNLLTTSIFGCRGAGCQ